MKKAGGIIALIAGIFGTIAAVVTLFFGGLGMAVEAKGGEDVVIMGWIGLLCSFLTIVFSAVAMGAKGKVPGILLIVTAVIAAYGGGTIVAVCMALVLVGGILALFGNQKKGA